MTPWVCPKCKRVYAPTMLACSPCNAAIAKGEKQEGGWKEAGHPWLWTYDPHLKEKKP